eukprot:Amastigsp_a761_82.p6 type:complete len:123 gc:universal Amastigsp_a761_82:791-423(-)
MRSSRTCAAAAWPPTPSRILCSSAGRRPPGTTPSSRLSLPTCRTGVSRCPRRWQRFSQTQPKRQAETPHPRRQAQLQSPQSHPRAPTPESDDDRRRPPTAVGDPPFTLLSNDDTRAAPSNRE